MDEQEAPSPIEKRFSLDELILSIISDLEELRAGKITVQDARARADLAKQAMNGVRLVINAQRFLESRALSLPSQNEDGR